MKQKIEEFLKSKYKYIVILVIGILFVMFSGGKSNEIKGTSLETKLRDTLEMAEGVGDVDVMVTFDENNKAEGAIIVAEGAENPTIKKMIHDSAVAALNLPDYKIQILIKQK